MPNRQLVLGGNYALTTMRLFPRGWKTKDEEWDGENTGIMVGWTGCEELETDVAILVYSSTVSSTAFRYVGIVAGVPPP